MIENLSQFVPSSACLKCDVCCRYPERNTPYVPYFFPEEIKELRKDGQFPTIGKLKDPKPFPVKNSHCYTCQFFIPKKNACGIYDRRPFDCRLYPFMITYDSDFKSIALVLDTKCPYLYGKKDEKAAKLYIDYLANLFEREETAEVINANKGFINDFEKDAIVLRKLVKLSERICFSSLGLKRISPGDKKIFERYFSDLKISASAFSFASIYIWSGILNILWAELGNTLCVFAGNNSDYFLLLPPVGAGFKRGVLTDSLAILSRMNDGDFPQRIENVPEEYSENLTSFGFVLKETSREYLYDQSELSKLTGNRFKTKRKLANNFVKSHKYAYRPLEERDMFECLELYKIWAEGRLRKNKDEYFRLLIEDSHFAQKKALTNLASLNIEGRIIELGGGIKGYSAGFPLNNNVFVILFETTDLNIKGLSQFMFKKFSEDLSKYKFINTLSDSGLKNLERVKKSYRPVRTGPIFTAFLNAN